MFVSAPSVDTFWLELLMWIVGESSEELLRENVVFISGDSISIGLEILVPLSHKSLFIKGL